jgi:hypothetical protein
VKLITLDIETFPNYFLIAFKSLDTSKVITFEIKNTNGKFTALETQKILSILNKYETFGFNSLNFDMPIVTASLTGCTAHKLNQLSNSIINDNMRPWQVLKQLNINLIDVNHFDLKEVAVGVGVSLKLYGGRLHSKRLQDLPIEPNATLSKSDMQAIRDYCINDLDTNIDLYNAIKPRLDVRRDMISQYGYNVLSKSDAQIAELVIKTDLQAINPNIDFNNKSTFDKIIYKTPNFIRFKTKILQDALLLIQNHEFNVLSNGSVELPKNLTDLNIKIGFTQYQLGIGGLHSKEKSQIVIPNKNQLLIDKDVTSYYPSIILNLGLYPKQLGKDFLTVFKNKVIERLNAKRNKDKVKSEVLKIVINGSYGKLGSVYSALYAPDLMLTTTLTGQLSLLMLIESLELYGIKVISANTDGVVSLLSKDKKELYEALCQDWELTTGFGLESNEYVGLYSKDVNNYLAITKDGFKGKGVFTLNHLSKNPQADICVEAVIAFLKYNVPLEKTINDCKDVCKFLIVRLVTGGAVYKSKYLGKVVRFYYSKNGTSIHYAKNNNKVPKSDGSKPLMELTELPIDIDYSRYIREAHDVLESLGHIGGRLC